MYDRLTRWLHLVFVIVIPLQLLSEEFMKRPKLVDGVPRIRSAAESNFFEMHEIMGMIALAAVVLHILWSATQAGGGLGRLFPCFKSGGCQNIIAEIKQIPGWFTGRLHESAEDSALAGAVHGLGLMLVLVMGLTGSTMFFGMDETTGEMNEFVHSMKELHEGLGGLVWVYLFGHVGMVVLHRLKGHNLFTRISPLSK